MLAKFDFFDPELMKFILQHPDAIDPVAASFLPSVLLLSLARILPIVAFCPFFGAKLMQRPAKVALALCLLSISFPYILSQVTERVLFNNFLI